MNQSTSNGKPTNESAANGDTPSKPTPQRRYRRPARAKSAAPQTSTQTTPAAELTGTVDTSAATSTSGTSAKNRPATGSAPASQTKNAPKKEGAARQSVQSAQPAATTPAAAPAANATTPVATTMPTARAQRPRNRTPRNARKSDVQLIVPPSPEASEINAVLTGEAANAVSAPDATPATPIAAVPVLTSETQVASSNTAAQEAAPAEPAPPPNRYRFARKSTPAVITTPTIRPERISGLQSDTPTAAIPAPTEASAPAAEPADTRAADTRAEETETPEQWKADVVEVTPQPTPGQPPAAPATSSFDLFTSSGERRASSAIDDIVSALGLRSAPVLVDPTPEDSGERIDTLVPAATAVQTESPEAQEQEEASTGESGEGENGIGGRRRRRRRRSSSHIAAEEDTDATSEPTPPARAVSPTPVTHSRSTVSASNSSSEPASAASQRSDRNGFEHYGNAGPFEQPYTPQFPAARERALQQPTQAQPTWDITTAQSHIQETDSPFGAPEPSFVRGFGPQPRGVAGPARDLYTTRPTRTERGTDSPPMSSNQLANIVSNAIQQQTDRLLSEMRHQQNPPSMTVMFPPFPSTERVGIFVDVANLLYSSRSQHITLDFGKLLEFLRGNRRLIRAHAYAPTNPDPGADQSFLTAVKGMGYRITTKNFKTFSSGAKKADMDLDLCMDIVRIVDAGALDTVVLVSGDSDFLPLLEYCSDHGVRVEAAAFDDSAALILRQSCDLFINLTLATDIRG